MPWWFMILFLFVCREGPAWETLSEAQRRVVDIELRDFVLGGVALEGEAKERYNAIQQQLAQLSTKFSNNVLDATKVRRSRGCAACCCLPCLAVDLSAAWASSRACRWCSAGRGSTQYTHPCICCKT
jgi:hypothetical protein